MSYKAGIVAAIVALKDRTGSSSIAIKKHMQANLPKDKKWKNATYLGALKMMVADGDLVQNKCSYKLSHDFRKKAPKSTKAAPTHRSRSTPQTTPIMASAPSTITIQLSPGSLGVGIQSREGKCVVSSIADDNTTTPLVVNDVIISLNGIKLSEVEGGVNAWVKLFQAFETVQRNLVVQRLGGSSTTAAKTAAAIPTKHSSMEVISLLDDSEDEGEANNASNGTGVDIEGSDRGSDIMEVSSLTTASSGWMRASSSMSSISGPNRVSLSPPTGNLKDDRAYGGESGEEELAVVATKGQNALADFPHSRANCVTHLFAASSDKKVHCANCYCYVCDIPANECKEWATHCEASHDDPHWRRERERAKRLAREPAPSNVARPATISRSSSSSFSFTSSSRSSSSASLSSASTGIRSAQFSVRSLLEKVTTVHPVEMSPPAGSGFTTALRHYQKQSLAFMVDTERTKKRGGWLCDEVGMGKSAVVLALVATNPASPKSLSTTQQINETVAKIAVNDQRREKIQREHAQKMVRMRQELYRDCEGKDSHREKELWDTFHENEHMEILKRDKKLSSEILPVEKIKLKPTVILTSVSLMGQWEDECKKHAPGLVVKTFHSSRTKNSNNLAHWQLRDIPSLNKIDLIISTSTFSWPADVTKDCEFHRIVQDESHLFGTASVRIDCANAISSSLRWNVTATPAISSTMELTKQLQFMRGGSKYESFTGDFSVLHQAMSEFHYRQSESRLNHLVDLLQTYMIRHTKSQRINGSEALALPPSTTSTVMLTMSKDESKAFNCMNSSAGTFSRHKSSGAKRFTVERVMFPQMGAVLFSKKHKNLSSVDSIRHGRERRSYIPERLTKVNALRKDLADLKKTEPHLRAVVFTHHLDVHEACKSGLRRDGFEVYEFTGSSDSTIRDAAIRGFQNTATRRPAVFVVTLRTGNVGITLTAASRVYLLEPSIDPAVEVQAAGRIHRLGQDKPCHVTKFAFKDSYEENVIKLHKKILDGKIAIVDGFIPPEGIKILGKGLRFGKI